MLFEPFFHSLAILMWHVQFSIEFLDDPYMVCEPPLPAANAGWPPGYSTDQYMDNFDLCSGLEGKVEDHHSRNVGCLCLEPLGQLLCDPRAGDSNLYPPPDGTGAPLNNGQTFKQHCQYHCRCTNEDIAWVYQEHNASGLAVFSDEYPATLNNDVLPWGSNTTENTSEGSASNSGINTTCNAQPNCTNSSSCGGNGCTCQTQATEVIPNGGGFIKYITGCGLILSSGPKRSQSDARIQASCPCNTTYVSHKCCDAGVSGMVWEAPEAKLGEVLLADDLKRL